MKFSALNVDFSSLSFNFLALNILSHASVK